MAAHHSRNRRPLPGYVLNETVVSRLNEKVMDSHCHIDFIDNKLKEKDKLETWSIQMSNLKLDPSNKFGGMVTNFCQPRDWDRSGCVQPDLMIKLQYAKGVYYTLGCHPQWTHELRRCWTKRMVHIIAQDRLGKCVGIGECGLDYHHKVNKDIQKKAFRHQIRLAMKLGMPLVIHVRDAQNDALKVMRDAGLPRDHSIHRHCFTGNIQQMNEWMEQFPNSVMGFTNLVTFPSATDVHDVVRTLSMDKIVLETDAPYFLPKGGKGIPGDSRPALYPPVIKIGLGGRPMSQPLNVLNVAAQVAAIKGSTLEKVLAANTRNIHRVYNIKS